MHLYDMSQFGIAIKQLRESLGLTQFNVYCSTGISEDTLRRLENGHALPRLETLSYLSLMYKTNLINLLNTCSIFNFYTDSSFMTNLNKMILNNDYHHIQLLITEIDNLIVKLNTQSIDQLLLNRLLLLKQFIEIIEIYKHTNPETLNRPELRARIERCLSAFNADFSLELKKNIDLNPIEMRLLLIYAELLRLENNALEALILLNALSVIAQKKHFIDPIFKELDLKIQFNIAYCYHRLAQHDQVIKLCNQALNQCVQYNSIHLLHLFLFRKAVAQHNLNDNEASQITYSDCMTLLKVTQQTELMSAYEQAYSKVTSRISPRQ